MDRRYQELVDDRDAEIARLRTQLYLLGPSWFYTSFRVAATALVVGTGFWSATVRPDPLFDLLSAASAALVVFVLWLSLEAQARMSGKNSKN